MGLMVYCALYTVLECVNCLLVYLLLFRAKVERRKWLVGGSLAVAVAVVCWFARKATGTEEELSIVYVLVMGLGVIVPIFWLQEHSWKWVLLYPICFMCFSTVQVVMSFLVSGISQLAYNRVLHNQEDSFLYEITTVCLFALFYVIMRARGILDEKVRMSKRQYAFFFLGTVYIVVILGFVQILCDDRGITETERMFLGTVVALFCLLFFLISMWNLLLVQSKQELKLRAEAFENFQQQQEQQIRSVLDNDEQIRRYRHDMKAHLMTMEALAVQSEGQEELLQYLQEVLNQAEAIKGTIRTGNQAVDAILGNLIQTAEKDGIVVKCHASLPEQLYISAFDLCTILSNLVRNAIEACRELVDRAEQPVINIELYPMEEHLFIGVKNPTAHEVQIRNQELITTKKDAENHGFGSKNVKSVVEKYSGTLQYECWDGFFTAEVYL